MIELATEYLDSLELGEHTLELEFGDGGIARTTFTVADPKSEEEPDAADTGVFTSVGGGAVATGISMVVIASIVGAVLVMTKKNKEA